VKQVIAGTAEGRELSRVGQQLFVVGTFEDRAVAERLVEALRQADADAGNKSGGSRGIIGKNYLTFITDPNTMETLLYHTADLLRAAVSGGRAGPAARRHGRCWRWRC